MQGMQYIPTITNYTKLWWVPNVVVAHQKEGIEAIHLPTGRTLCKVGPSSYSSGHEQAYDFAYPFFTLLVSLNSSYLQLHLLEGGLHADINGDGVLDHVQVHTSDTTAAFGSLAFFMGLQFLRPYLHCVHLRLSEAMLEREL